MTLESAELVLVNRRRTTVHNTHHGAQERPKGGATPLSVLLLSLAACDRMAVSVLPSDNALGGRYPLANAFVHDLWRATVLAPSLSALAGAVVLGFMHALDRSSSPRWLTVLSSSFRESTPSELIANKLSVSVHHLTGALPMVKSTASSLASGQSAHGVLEAAVQESGQASLSTSVLGQNAGSQRTTTRGLRMVVWPWRGPWALGVKVPSVQRYFRAPVQSARPVRF
ncbi:hypothetical protein B0H63DRAFT_513919 [Podospora didyma]|uniref:Uncharacterized protein n=1 Tax=Podospora didyma TaxID=330526 RepID=A0AAE0K9U1_9PEZI|nr:hypothetical protein B0H63DRAFT_513919 [Podospora didyma]